MKEAGNNSKKKPHRPGEANMDDEERHKFLAYLLPQLEPLRQACEHNFLTQAGLIALAGSHLYSNSTTLFGLTLPNEVLNIVFPLVLTYLTIRMGYLINAYIFIRDGITTALSDFVNRTPEFQDDNAERMLRANSLVELFCLEYKRKNRRVRNAALVILPVILSAIFAFNHNLGLFYLRRIYGFQPILAIVLAIVLGLSMTACYMHFLFTRKPKGAKFIARATIVLSVAGFLAQRMLV